MKKISLYLFVCMIIAVTASCHSDHDFYTTTAGIELTMPVEGEVEIIQYSLTMTNLNSREVVNNAGKTTGTIMINDIMRGAYSINVEGIVKYKNESGQVTMRQFRAQSEYVSFVGQQDAVVTLEMILMD